MITAKPPGLSHLFWRQVRPLRSGCWKWTGALTQKGYGQAGLEGRKGTAHRLAYEVLLGSIPPGYQLHHNCHHRWCVNPLHMELVPSIAHSALHVFEYLGLPPDAEMYALNDFARAGRMSRQQAYELAKRATFPAPVHVTPFGRLWARSAVEEWLHSWPRKVGRPAKQAS